MFSLRNKKKYSVDTPFLSGAMLIHLVYTWGIISVTSCLISCAQILFWEGVYSKGKGLAPNRTKLFFFWVDSFMKGVRRNVDRVASTENVSIPLHREACAGLGGSVGCTVRLETRRSRVQPPPRSATFFCGDWSWNIFYGHSLPSADSRRAVVSFWRKNVHNTG